MISALFALALLADTSVATAVAQPAGTAAGEPAKEKKICKTDPNYTGSRMRKKLCLTQTEWDLKSQGKDAADIKTIGGR